MDITQAMPNTYDADNQTDAQTGDAQPPESPLGKPTAPKAPVPNGRLLNAAIHGARFKTLVLGSMPKPLLRCERMGRAYRIELRQLVLDERGTISAAEEHEIDAITSHHMHSLLCSWLLRTKLGEMTPLDVMRCSQAILDAKSARNKRLASLGFSVSPPEPVDVWLTPAKELPAADEQADEPEDSPDARTPPRASGDALDTVEHQADAGSDDDEEYILWTA